MSFLNLLTLHGRGPLVRIALACILSAGSALAILAVINIAAQEIADQGVDTVDWAQAAIFGLAAGLFLVSESYLVARIGGAIEDGIHTLRMRLLDRLIAAEYVHVERFGQDALFQSISQNSQMVSDNSSLLAMAVRSAVLALAILGYILWLSPVAFVLVLATLGVGGRLYVLKGASVQAGFQAMMGAEGRLFGAVQDLFDGAKEVRMSSRRSAEIGRAFCTVASRARRLGTDVQGLANGQFVFGQVAFYALLAVVAFILPLYSSGFDSKVLQVTTAVLFMIGPVGGILGTMPMMASADAAVRRMVALEDELTAFAPAVPASVDALAPDFDRITIRDAGFSYPAAEGDTPFTVGPINLTIQRGEVIFVTGGNGSGKSSFIKMLTGLYAPHHGLIAVDGVPIQGTTVAAYRELMATVFSNSHLFARLYGVPTPDAAEVAELFRLFEMEHVTTLDGDRFGRTAVSMGQRKRLALMAALLEHKPILVLDEWAADQDPHFRRVFYRTILPALRRRGMTIIAVTHDDHYFDAADRILNFSFGTMTEVPVRQSEDAQ